MSYQFLEDVATADIAFRAWGKDLPELFKAAGDATINTMIEDLDSIEPKETRTFSLEVQFSARASLLQRQRTPAAAIFSN
jgi:SHS2 domain-containing protein